jgi:hypothetical protein
LLGISFKKSLFNLEKLLKNPLVIINGFLDKSSDDRFEKVFDISFSMNSFNSIPDKSR